MDTSPSTSRGTPTNSGHQGSLNFSSTLLGPFDNPSPPTMLHNQQPQLGGPCDHQLMGAGGGGGGPPKTNADCMPIQYAGGHPQAPPQLHPCHHGLTLNGQGQQGVLPALASVMGSAVEPYICAGCGGKIADRFMLKALDKLWHEDCLKCDACCCRLAEVGKSLFVKCGKIYCRRDYARLFGAKGTCSSCNNVIPAFELVMRANANVYHLECFCCQECNLRFCVGDRFYLDTDNNKILCEYDYNERLYFAQLSLGYNSLAQLRRQIDDYDEAMHSMPR